MGQRVLWANKVSRWVETLTRDTDVSRLNAITGLLAQTVKRETS
jgi:hypothetical protein